MCHRKSSMEWRCHACFGEPTFCTTCLRSTHRSRPFHKVSKWSGRCFEPSTLLEADVTLNLCHNGELCPEYGNTVRKYDERWLRLYLPFQRIPQNDVNRILLKRPTSRACQPSRQESSCPIASFRWMTWKRMLAIILRISPFQRSVSHRRR